MNPPYLNNYSPLIDGLATAKTLLVATDFDGTLAPLVDDPAQSEINPIARAALAKLCEFPSTEVYVISGRSLASLQIHLAGLSKVRLVGGHGSEFDVGFSEALSEFQHKVLIEAQVIIELAARSIPGAHVECKPHGIALHYRRTTIDPQQFITKLEHDLKKLPAGSVKYGKSVIEFIVTPTDKGSALAHVQKRLKPETTIFLGDDLTDEDVFRVAKDEVTIKVGDEDTAAKFRIRNIDDVSLFLDQLAKSRERFIHSENSTPINKHIFLSDQKTMLIMDDQANIVWQCLPRADSAPLFGSLVGGPAAGHFSIAPISGFAITQNYVRDTLICVTKWPELTVTDFLECDSKKSVDSTQYSKLIRIISGTGLVRAEFAPRWNFGRVPTRITQSGTDIKVEGWPQSFKLLADQRWSWEIKHEGGHDTAIGTRILTEESVTLEMQFGSSDTGNVPPTVSERLADTSSFWKELAAKTQLPKIHADLISRSAMVLQGLIYGPSGAIFAAATTSLPETVSGIRNWDYRYCWPRDAAYTAFVLARLGVYDPGLRLLTWLLHILEQQSPETFLAPVYDVEGKHLAGEGEITEAWGYRGSRPVRIGNLAAQQLQLDVLGPIAELLAILANSGAALKASHWQLALRMIDLIEKRWREPDHGIWEIRGAQRHYVHSKLMCWYTIQQLAILAKQLKYDQPNWQMLADEIRQDIETNGFSEKLNSYVAAYDLEEADASLLWIVLSDFHPPTHPRSIGTVEFLVKQLLIDDVMYRYRFDDGLPGKEGGFQICLSWLMEVLVMQGHVKKANELFEKLTFYSQPHGLLSEQWDPAFNSAVGNYPQAYSHVGLINAALALGKAATSSA